MVDCCHPKILRKDLQKNNNLIVALHPYVTGELMITEAETLKSKLEHKKYQKRAKPDLMMKNLISWSSWKRSNKSK
mgnify:CR=1 FL=1